MPLIEIKNASVVYNEGSDNQVNALLGASLEIEPQEYIIIFGPSGCGKSTLLNVIAGLEKPTHGEAYIDSEDLNEMNADQLAKFHCVKIGMIFQAYNILPSLSVRDNIILPQMFLGANDRKNRRAKADKLLDKFGILAQANKAPSELSGGQQQRIGIARALINDQPIVLADEPVGNLDSKSAQNVLDILKELNEKDKKTIIMVTHNPEYLDCAHRVFYMKDGKIEREIVNKKHPNLKPKEKITPQEKELDLLMRSFPGFSEAQLHMLMIPFKAKILSEYLLASEDVDQIQRLEELVRKRMLGKLAGYEFRMMLDRPIEKGGVGLDERTAINYSHEAEKILEGAKLLQKNLKETASKLNLEEFDLKVKLISRYLTRSFIKEIDERQKNRLEHLVKIRMTNEIGKEMFSKVLDKPFKEGGVGLDKRIVKKIVKDVEIILLVKFGMGETKVKTL
jgi:ABC-type lipoprotein export system ATPase subunit